MFFFCSKNARKNKQRKHRTKNETGLRSTLNRPTRILSRIQNASEPLFESKYVEVSANDDEVDVVAGDGGLQAHAELHIVDSGEVQASGRLAVLGEQAKTVDVDVSARDVGVVLVGLHHAEVSCLAFESREVVHEQSCALNGVASPGAGVIEGVIGSALAAALHGPHELQHRVIEVELHGDLLGLVARGAKVLDLRNELLEGADGEAIAFLHVQVDVRGVQVGAHVCVCNGLVVAAFDHQDVGIGHLNQVLQAGKVGMDHEGVELQGDQWQNVAGVSGEVERKRHIETSRSLGHVNELQARVSFANHLFQVLARLARELLPHVQVVAVERVNDLTTDGEGDAWQGRKANFIHPVRPRP